MRFITRTFLSAALAVLAGSTVVTAMPPHPDLLDQVAAGKKASSFYLDNRDALREQGTLPAERSAEARSLCRQRSGICFSLV